MDKRCKGPLAGRAMGQWLWLFMVLTISGCAAAVMSGNATTVVIGRFTPLTVAEAQPLANKHCAEYGKVAELHHAGTRDIYFDCVETKGSQ